MCNPPKQILLCRLFKKEPTPQELARSTQRDIGRNVRDLDREIASLQRDEKKLILVSWEGGGLIAVLLLACLIVPATSGCPSASALSLLDPPTPSPASKVQEIKAAARQGNQAGTRILAQQLVRLRAHITKLRTTQAQLRGVGLSVTMSCRPWDGGACFLTGTPDGEKVWWTSYLPSLVYIRLVHTHGATQACRDVLKG